MPMFQGTTDEKLNNQRQDKTRFGGLIGSSTANSSLTVDVIIGDSLGRGAGATLGINDWATQLCTIENRSLGLPDPGPGLVLAALDEGAYGNLKFATPSTATVGSTGPSAGSASAGTPNPATNLELTANNMTIQDTRVFRRVQVFYENQPDGGTFQVSVNGGSNYTSNISTVGTAGTYDSYTSADLTTAISRNLRVKGTSSSNVRIIGARYYQTAGITGIVMDNLSKGGTTAADWVTNRGWETWVSLVRPRRVYICTGNNDAIQGRTPAQFKDDVTTLIQRAQTAYSLAEVVVIGEYYASKPTVGLGNVGFEKWKAQWLPAAEAAAFENSATYIDLGAKFGDCSEGVDPYGLTMDGGLHFGVAGTTFTDGVENETTTFTSATATFTSADTGKGIIGDGIPNGTTVTYVSATTVTLSAAATRTQTAVPFMICRSSAGGRDAQKAFAANLYERLSFGYDVPAYADLATAQTLTNKRVTPRVGTATSSATPTINTDNVDLYSLTAQAAAITSMTTNLSGTPTNGQELVLVIVGTGTFDITWGTGFESSAVVALPTTGAITTTRTDMTFRYNSATSKWRLIELV